MKNSQYHALLGWMWIFTAVIIAQFPIKVWTDIVVVLWFVLNSLLCAYSSHRAKKREEWTIKNPTTEELRGVKERVEQELNKRKHN